MEENRNHVYTQEPQRSANKYQKKYRKARLFNIIFASIIVGMLIGGLFTYGLISTGDFKLINEAHAVQSDSVTRINPINEGYEEPVIQVADKVIPSIVMIRSKVKAPGFFGEEQINTGTGSGIIYKEDGYIITNNHVIEKAAEIEVVLHDGKTYKARVLGADAKTDLAVIKIDAKNLPAGNLGDSSEIKVGQLAVAIGTPMGEEFSGSVTSGIISALNRTLTIGEKKLKLIQTDAAINPGNSGGALANKYGEIIGINSVKLSSPNVEGMGFAIPINDALPIIDELIDHGYVKRPWIGVGISTVTEDMAERYNVPTGIYIAKVYYNSPAEGAGLKVDDIITEINGERIHSVQDLSEKTEALNPEDTVTLKIYRDKTEQEVQLKLGIMPPDRN